MPMMKPQQNIQKSLNPTEEMESAWTSISTFLFSDQNFYCVEGFSGTGKSFFINYLYKNSNKLLDVGKLYGVFKQTTSFKLIITATTHKACEVHHSYGIPSTTLHAYLGVRISSDRTPIFQPTYPSDREDVVLVVVDESSMISVNEMFQYLVAHTQKRTNVKYLFVGDPYQLLSVDNRNNKTVFDFIPNKSCLTQVLRQDNSEKLNPITQFGINLKDWVKTETLRSIDLDNQTIIQLDRSAFNQAIEQEFSKTNWTVEDSAVLAWRNNTVLEYNAQIHKLRTQSQTLFHAGDYVVSNRFYRESDYSVMVDKYWKMLNTDMLVLRGSNSADILRLINNTSVWVERIVETTLSCRNTNFEIDCYILTLRDSQSRQHAIVPKKWTELKQLKKLLSDSKIYEKSTSIFVDVRHRYASTVDKAQGSTFKKVFIDLDDLAQCRFKSRLRRMLYVAVTRASEQVIVTGGI